uniref:GK20482 n=1 Tax=Drosophila willistoni TaxID=7260 RepID=B4N505_DROWI
MSRLIAGARGLFRRHPFVSNSIIYGSLYVGAEYSQQFVTKQWLALPQEREDIDYATIGRYAVMGTAAYAPSLYIWYKWLDRTFPGTTKTIIVKKLVLDQFLLTPYLLTVFYAGMSIMEGSDDIFLELREKFMPTFFPPSEHNKEKRTHVTPPALAHFKSLKAVAQMSEKASSQPEKTKT